MNELPPTPMEPTLPNANTGKLVTETFEHDGGRQVTVYIPPNPPEVTIFAFEKVIYVPFTKPHTL